MKNKQGNKIRIKDIAARAGVSPGTVDRVLHKRGEVAEETRRQIMEIVDQLGYEPNLVAKSLAMKKTCRIAVLMPDPANDNPYWEKPEFGILHAAREVKDFNTSVSIYNFGMNSEKSYLNAFSELMKEPPDGLIFTPIFYHSSFDIIRECEEHSIPYIFMNMRLDGCNNLAYFGQNAIQSGFLAGKLLHFSLQEHSKILIVKPNSHQGTGFHLQRREKGFLSFFLSGSNVKDIQCHEAETDPYKREVLFRDLDKAFEQYPNISGIFITNSRASKIAQYLYERGRKGLMLVGYDLVNENVDFLERGIITFLIGQKPEEQGYKSILAMFNYLMADKHMEKTNYSPIDIIMKENIDYYKNYKF
ncbi:MAG: LacI family DNA-binding transcriptional regulator [Bacteroidales bacterium]|nr:LacI family DNA-binding transcriptional regulator [Bacteroidales bacterium]